MRHRSLSVLLAAVAALLLVPATALADQHVDEGPLTLEPSTVQPGDSFTVSGDCPEEAGGEQLSVLGTDPGGGQLGTVTLDADGSFSGEASVSENSPAGDLEVSVICGVDTVALKAQLTITEGDGTADEDVPVGGVETGFGGAATASSSAMLVGGLGLLLALAGGVLFARRGHA